jgi:hypothetical protein
MAAWRLSERSIHEFPRDRQVLYEAVLYFLAKRPWSSLQKIDQALCACASWLFTVSGNGDPACQSRNLVVRVMREASDAVASVARDRHLQQQAQRAPAASDTRRHLTSTRTHRDPQRDLDQRGHGLVRVRSQRVLRSRGSAVVRQRVNKDRNRLRALEPPQSFYNSRDWMLTSDSAQDGEGLLVKRRSQASRRRAQNGLVAKALDRIDCRPPRCDEVFEDIGCVQRPKGANRSNTRLENSGTVSFEQDFAQDRYGVGADPD